MHPAGRLPEWVHNRGGNWPSDHELKRKFRGYGLHTVCESARCPNRRECFSRGTATFMILGDTCTRRCGFCAVATGRPEAIGSLIQEPEFVARCVAEMHLRHVVITSVARDDLEDGGAGHFVRTIAAVRKRCSNTRIEILTPDFKGSAASIHAVLDAGPDVFNHNVETVERLTPRVRPQGKYTRSLAVLKEAKQYAPGILCKSGFMLGLGESAIEVQQLFRDLFDAGIDILTIGQYLQPTRLHLPVVEYVEPAEFESWREFGRSLGFRAVFAGPLVRSSYMAEHLADGLMTW